MIERSETLILFCHDRKGTTSVPIANDHTYPSCLSCKEICTFTFDVVLILFLLSHILCVILVFRLIKWHYFKPSKTLPFCHFLVSDENCELQTEMRDVRN